MQNPPDILQKIIRQKQQVVAERKRKIPLQVLQEKLSQAPKPRGFIQAIQDKLNARKIAVIAEIKKASPSKGVIRQDFNPVEIANSYAKHGACCLSILTDEEFFQGSDECLKQVRAAVALPILRKDFMMDTYQIYESRIIGADCILLIVAALSDEQLKEFSILAQQLNLDVLVEVHDAAELDRALKLNTQLIGINNRDLRTFTTRLGTTLDLLKKIPQDKIIVTESGIHTRADIALMKKRGVNTFLIGEAFMSANDPGEKLAELVG